MATFAISFVGLSGIDVFAGPSTGDAVLALLAYFVVFHAVAFFAGLFLNEPNAFRAPVVLAIALLPIGLLYVGELYDRLVLAPQRPYARFRELVVSPIPDSVTNLEFVPFEETGSTHLTLRFRIAPEDLDILIEKRGFVVTNLNDFRCPVDEFKNPYFLPLPGPVTYYTYEDNESGYPEPGWGDGHTLKVSRDRTRVIYRHESAPFYRYRYWESDNY